jgi:hypothetical protein
VTSLSPLSAAGLLALLDKRELAMSEATHAAISAGMGNTPPHEIRMMAADGDPVARRWVLAADQIQEARWEQKFRRDYHGTDEPIRRPIPRSSPAFDEVDEDRPY